MKEQPENGTGTVPMSSIPKQRSGIPFAVLVAVTFVVIGLEACSTVKPYQRAYLNDQAMQIGTQPAASFSDNVHTYREGSSGGGSEKGSGGCGCN